MADPVSGSRPFVMRGARAALEDGLAHIEEQVKALEQAVMENPGLAFDLAKTLVESACRTILAERKQPYSKEDDLPKLFKTVTTFLPLAPPAFVGTADEQRSLKQTVGGLHTALQGVCELRNDFGFASHGTDGARPRMESIQAMLAAQAADAIVAFLYSTHRQDQEAREVRSVRFEDHSKFNENVDDLHGSIEIFDLSFRPSEVLFRLDPAAYRDALATFDGLKDETNTENSKASTEDS